MIVVRFCCLLFVGCWPLCVVCCMLLLCVLVSIVYVCVIVVCCCCCLLRSVGCSLLVARCLLCVVC